MFDMKITYIEIIHNLFIRILFLFCVTCQNGIFAFVSAYYVCVCVFGQRACCICVCVCLLEGKRSGTQTENALLMSAFNGNMHER